jgi:WD40 repeat protein
LGNVETHNISFAAFNPTGRLVFTNSKEKFAVWDLSGSLYCSAPDIGYHIAYSADGRWMAASEAGDATVRVWNLRKALNVCGIPDSLTTP